MPCEIWRISFFIWENCLTSWPTACTFVPEPWAIRRRRIARGSGTSVQAVSQLVKQFAQMKKLMKQMAGGKMPSLQQLAGGR